MTKNLAFSLQDAGDIAHSIGAYISAHTDQIQTVNADITSAITALAAGNVPGTITALTPVVQLVWSDLVAFEKPAVTPAALKASAHNLGANGAIIAQLIAALQAGQGKVIISIIQAMIAAFGGAAKPPVVTPIAKPAGA